MMVCAHMNLGPHKHVYRKFSTISGAVESFRDTLERHYGAVDSSIAQIRGGDMPCVDLYPACTAADWRAGLHCSDVENFHEFAVARYQVGPRGGIGKVSV